MQHVRLVTAVSITIRLDTAWPSRSSTTILCKVHLNEMDSACLLTLCLVKLLEHCSKQARTDPERLRTHLQGTLSVDLSNAEWLLVWQLCHLGAIALTSADPCSKANNLHHHLTCHLSHPLLRPSFNVHSIILVSMGPLSSFSLSAIAQIIIALHHRHRHNLCA